MRQKKAVNTVCFHLFVGFLGFIMIYPLIWMVFSAFKESSLYECEPIPGGMVVYDNEGFAFVCDARVFQKPFQVLGRSHQHPDPGQ
jgi:ABC-type glycerol-3-phosphate transport system permease component